jgi:hypothetical protein
MTGSLRESFGGRVEYRLDSLVSHGDSTTFRLTMKVAGIQVGASAGTNQVVADRQSRFRIRLDDAGQLEIHSDSSWAVPAFASGANLIHGWRRAAYRGDTLFYNRITTPPCISTSREYLQGVGLIRESKGVICGMTSESEEWTLLEFNSVPFNRLDLIELDPPDSIRKQGRGKPGIQPGRWPWRGGRYRADGRSMPEGNVGALPYPARRSDLD